MPAASGSSAANYLATVACRRGRGGLTAGYVESGSRQAPAAPTKVRGREKGQSACEPGDRVCGLPRRALSSLRFLAPSTNVSNSAPSRASKAIGHPRGTGQRDKAGSRVPRARPTTRVMFQAASTTRLPDTRLLHTLAPPGPTPRRAACEVSRHEVTGGHCRKATLSNLVMGAWQPRAQHAGAEGRSAHLHALQTLWAWLTRTGSVC